MGWFVEGGVNPVSLSSTLLCEGGSALSTREAVQAYWANKRVLGSTRQSNSHFQEFVRGIFPTSQVLAWFCCQLPARWSRLVWIRQRLVVVGPRPTPTTIELLPASVTQVNVAAPACVPPSAKHASGLL